MQTLLEQLEAEAYEIQNATPSKRKKRAANGTIPKAIKDEMKRYAAPFKALYKRSPEWTYAKPYVRIEGQPGVTLKRLQQLTRMLRERCKDL